MSNVEDEKKIDSGARGLVLMEPTSVLARAVMQQANKEMHAGAKHMLASCRKFCWIVRGKQLSDKIVKGCLRCKIQKSKCATPLIADRR